jgi:hypothetical protein
VKTDAERLALLEYKDELREAKLEEIGNKLDELLVLRQKGMGAFWLASSLLGTGIVGAALMLINYFRG